jgi:hypothetical protein
MIPFLEVLDLLQKVSRNIHKVKVEKDIEALLKKKPSNLESTVRQIYNLKV